MINLQNISSYGNKLYQNFDQVVKNTGVTQKIYNLGKSVLNYCNRHQNALQAFTWYCLIIEVSSYTFEVLSTSDNYNLDTCQDMVCHLWNTTTNETRHLFSPYIKFRCSPSDPNYHPFYFMEKCKNDLCQYATKVGLNFTVCRTYSDAISKEGGRENLDFTYDLWDKLCPKKSFRHTSLIKEATYINACLHSICNYFNTFEVTIEPDLANLCENIKTLKLNELLIRLSKLIHNSEKKL